MSTARVRLKKRRGSDRGVLCYGGKRDFSPYLNRGLGESHSTQYAVRSTQKYASTRVREKSLSSRLDGKEGRRGDFSFFESAGTAIARQIHAPRLQT